MVATHRFEHDIPAGCRSRKADSWGVRRRRLGQSREQRRLWNVYIGRVLAEIPQRRRLYSIEAVAEVHLVQVHLEDLVLRELALEPRGEEHLGDLPPERLGGSEKVLPRQLLRQGASPLGGTARS